MQTVQHPRLPMSKDTKGPTRGRIARLLDDLQARGDLVVSVDDAAEQSTLSRIAAQRQLERLAPRANPLPRRPSALLILPPRHPVRGAPPLAAPVDQDLCAHGPRSHV